MCVPMQAISTDAEVSDDSIQRCVKVKMKRSFSIALQERSSATSLTRITSLDLVKISSPCTRRRSSQTNIALALLVSRLYPERELERAKARHKNGEIEVVPVLLYPMDLEHDCEFLYQLILCPNGVKAATAEACLLNRGVPIRMNRGGDFSTIYKRIILSTGSAEHAVFARKRGESHRDYCVRLLYIIDTSWARARKCSSLQRARTLPATGKLPRRRC